MKISRRRLLASAAGLAIGASALGKSASQAAPPGRAIEVLVHDEIQNGAEFGRGRLLGAKLRGGILEGDGLFESEIITSPFAFTHVGIHWKGQGRGLGDVRLEARSSLDGSSWTPWLPVTIEARPEDTPGGETYGAVLGAPRHQLLQYRAHVTSQSQLSTISATFLNSVDGPAKAQLTVALAANPVIDKTRADWGCDESLRFRGKREIWARMYVPVKKLVVHHTATERYLISDAEVEQEVRAIYTYHARTLGWGDIGYGALIGMNGKSYEGRYGRGNDASREVFSHDVVAGHALDHNYGSSGVALIGYFHPPVLHQPTTAMLNRLLDVFEQVGLAWEIDPNTRSNFLKSSGGWNTGPANNGLINFCGHRDCSATDCPGDIIYSQLDGETGLRNQLKSRLETGLPLLEGPAPLLTGPDSISTTNNGLSYSWSGGNGLQYSYYLEGWYKSSRSESITYLTGFDLDRKPIWTPWNTEPLSKAYTGLADGHYTFHVRSKDAEGNVSYQGNKTVHII
jgi:hypothetical protein